MHLFQRLLYHMLVPSSSNIFDIVGLNLKETFICLIHFDGFFYFMMILLHPLNKRPMACLNGLKTIF